MSAIRVARYLAGIFFVIMLSMILTYDAQAQYAHRAYAITIRQTPDTLKRGDALKLRVLVVDSRGRPLSREPVWTSSDPSRATVDAHGVVYGICGGPTTIRASVDRISASRVLQIKAPPLGNIVPILPTKTMRANLDSATIMSLAIRDLATGCIYKMAKWIPPEP